MEPIDDRVSAERAENVEAEETEENVRSGEGHEEVAGVGDIEGEGDPSRRRGGEVDCSIVE